MSSLGAGPGPFRVVAVLRASADRLEVWAGDCLTPGVLLYDTADRADANAASVRLARLFGCRALPLGVEPLA